MKKALIFYVILGGGVYLYLKNKKTKTKVEGIDVVEEQEVKPVKTDIPLKAVLINNMPISKTEYHHVPSYNPRGHKAYMDRFLVTPERQIVSAL